MNCEHVFDYRDICTKCFMTEAEVRWWPTLDDINRATIMNQVKNRTPRRVPTVDELI